MTEAKETFGQLGVELDLHDEFSTVLDELVPA